MTSVVYISDLQFKVLSVCYVFDRSKYGACDDKASAPSEQRQGEQGGGGGEERTKEKVKKLRVIFRLSLTIVRLIHVPRSRKWVISKNIVNEFVQCAWSLVKVAGLYEFNLLSWKVIK